MRKTLKVAVIAVVAFLALGAVAFVYANSQKGVAVNANEQQMGMQDPQTFYWSNSGLSDNITTPDNVGAPCHIMGKPGMWGNGLQPGGGFLENATLSTVNGTVVSEVRGMLVLDTGSGEIRIQLPREWTVGTEVVDRASLFNSTFASPGMSVTVKVLESSLFSNANFSINAIMGYEAINATSTHAYAVLPFNIQPNS